MSGIRVTNSEVSRRAAKLGCKEGKLPFIYLGIPIGASMGKEKNWKPLYDRFNKKLLCWKGNTLSSGGRLTLCKAVLGGLGIYYLSLFKAPTCVIKTLEGIRRRFFWGTWADKTKISWMAWDKVCASTPKGGLGIAKCWWRFRTET